MSIKKITPEEFCVLVKMPEAAAGIIEEERLKTEAKEYRAVRETFFRDWQEFNRQVNREEGSSRRFLYYYVMFACEAYEDYQRKGLTEQLYLDTFSDYRIWCENCYAQTGEYGLRECEWLWRHSYLKLFRLGRLQYELYPAREDISTGGFEIKKGQMLLNIHIPQGEPLRFEACEDSLRKAQKMFPDFHYFVCDSWLLYPGLNELMKPDSNIIRFQERFHIFEVNEAERDAELRIFRTVREAPADYPEDTAFQKRAKAYLLAGRHLGNASGIFML